MRSYIRIVESVTLESDSDYPNLRVVETGMTFTAYHGTPSLEPFTEFDPSRMNSQTGKAHGAFFFSGTRATAMTYMNNEEVLKPEAQALYDRLMASSNAGMKVVTVKANALLQSYGLPPMKRTFSKLDAWAIGRDHKKIDPSSNLSAELDALGHEAGPHLAASSRALDLYENPRNVRMERTGTLYTCEIHASRIWERDLDGGAFEVNRWRDIFNTAHQSGADTVILYNAVDTASDFGSPDTIYAVLEPARIKIIDHVVFGEH